jgi:hypothetical protein
MRSLSSLCFVLLLACSDTAAAPQEAAATSGDEADASTQACEPGRDQTCNDDPAISSLHGTCKPDGSCECAAGVEKNPATGRCL